MRCHSSKLSSAGGEHVKPKAPEEQAAARVSRFRSDAEQAATSANKLADTVILEQWRAARANVEKRHDDLQGVLADREKDAALAGQAREDLDAAKLIDAAGLLERPADLETMRDAARAFGRPGAAAAVADLVLALAQRRPLPSVDAIERASRAAA